VITTEEKNRLGSVKERECISKRRQRKGLDIVARYWEEKKNLLRFTITHYFIRR
jgi:hypothetical protein